MPKKPSAVFELERETKPLRIAQLDLLAPSFGSADGYGNSAEQMALALERAGLPVSIVGTAFRTGFSNAEHIRNRPHERQGDVILYYSQPPSWATQQGGRKAIGFSMYEADRLPSPWLPRLSCVDEIWVPSSWNAELFEAAMASSPYKKPPVHVIPLGVDANAFSYSRRERGDKLRLLHFATYGGEVRKGADLAIAAFQAAFPGRHDVELVLRSTFTHSGVDVADGRIHNEYGALTTPELANYYRTFDALLYPSRGEGFGLIPLEAMATGMPAIFPRATGMRDYGHLGMWVDAQAMPATIGYGRGDTAVEGVPFGMWQQPSLHELVARLHELDTDYEAVMDRSQRDAATIASDWTWDHTATAMIARLSA